MKVIGLPGSRNLAIVPIPMEIGSKELRKDSCTTIFLPIISMMILW